MEYIVIGDFLFKSVVLSTMFFCFSLCAMEENKSNLIDNMLSEEILKNGLWPHCRLQSIARFANTSTINQNRWNPGKISHHHLPGFVDVEIDYIRCAYALGKFAVCENTKMFEYFYAFDRLTRDKGIYSFFQKVDESACCENIPEQRMAIYRKHYHSARLVNKRIADELRSGINRADSDAILLISDGKECDMFKLFDMHTVEQAF